MFDYKKKGFDSLVYKIIIEWLLTILPEYSSLD